MKKLLSIALLSAAVISLQAGLFDGATSHVKQTVGRLTPAAHKKLIAQINKAEQKYKAHRDFMNRARFTPEGLKKAKLKLKDLENEIKVLKKKLRSF